MAARMIAGGSVPSHISMMKARITPMASISAMRHSAKTSRQPAKNSKISNVFSKVPLRPKDRRNVFTDAMYHSFLGGDTGRGGYNAAVLPGT